MGGLPIDTDGGIPWCSEESHQSASRDLSTMEAVSPNLPRGWGVLHTVRYRGDDACGRTVSNLQWRGENEESANAAQAALDFITDNAPHLLQPPSVPVANLGYLGEVGVKGHYKTYRWMK